MAERVTINLLSEFTRNNVDWLRQTATARRASLSPEEWSELAIVCEFIADLAKKYRDLIHATLERGIEAGTLQVRLHQSTAFLADAVQTMAELQQGGTRVSPNVRAALDRIRKAHAETEAIHADLASLLVLAKVEPPPVPEDILAAAEAGTFIRLDDFRKSR
jgi:hypothetical protein